MMNFVPVKNFSIFLRSALYEIIDVQLFPSLEGLCPIDPRISALETNPFHPDFSDRSEPVFEQIGVASKFDWETVMKENPEIVDIYGKLFDNHDESWVQMTSIEPDIYLGGFRIQSPTNLEHKTWIN